MRTIQCKSIGYLHQFYKAFLDFMLTSLVSSKPHGASTLSGALENFFKPNEKSSAETSLHSFLDSMLESKNDTEPETDFMMNYLSPENQIKSLLKGMLALHETLDRHTQ